MKRLTELSRKLAAWVESLRGSEEGQTLIEYIMVLVVVALAIVIFYVNSNIATTINTALININAKLNLP